VKARHVKGLDPSAAVADNLERIVAVRLDELCSFVPRALDPGEVKALHDMRIAAKRLRYILEVAAEPCFGPYAQTAIKRTKWLQDLLGDIHDCDVQLPRVRAFQEELRRLDVAEARARAADADDLDPTLASGTPHAEDWRGLETLVIYLSARRELLFKRFLALWVEMEQDDFRGRLEGAVGERPFTSPSHDGNRTPRDTPVESRPQAP
jgi:hypothetical protein